MATKPTVFLNWCPDGDPAKVVQPSSALATAGYVPGQVPVAQHFNWLVYQTDQWLQWLADAANLNLVQGTFNGARPLSARMIGGGNWSFNYSTSTLTWSAAWNLVIPGLPTTANNVAAGSITIADGACAYVTANLPLTAAGNVSSGSSSIVAMTNTAGIQIGMTVTGPGIPASTLITAVTTDSVQMSNTATGTTAGAHLVFSFVASLAAASAADASIDASDGRKVVFARRVGTQVFVGAPGHMLVLMDGMSRPLMQDRTTFTATAGESISAGQAVYMSPGSDGGRTAGQLYRTDASAANGAIRANPLGIMLNNVASGQTAIVSTKGIVSVLSGLTVGAAYYLDPATLGGLTATAPSSGGQYLAKIGTALAATQLLVGPEPRARAQAPVVTQAYRTSVANVTFNQGGSAGYTITVGSSDGAVTFAGTGSSVVNGVVPLLIPDTGTILSITIDLVATVALTNWNCYVNRMRNGGVQGIAGGGLSGMSSTTVGSSAIKRYDLGSITASDIASGDRFYLILQWSPGAPVANVAFYDIAMNISTASPAVVTG